MRARELLSEAASQRIEAAVRDAELRTSGEIVPMVVDRSDDYLAIRIGSFAVMALAAGLIALSTPLDARIWVAPIQLAAGALAYLATGRAEVLRRLIRRAEREQRARQAAGLAFLDLDLTATRERSGILLYVSLLEHQVVVLADRGIHAQVEPGTWHGVVDRIVEGIRAERAEAGLCDAIAMCADLLAERFPRRPDDVNELPDRPLG